MDYPNAENPRTPALKGMFRAFSGRNYRLFFVGQGLSLTGTWMQSIAMSWLVYRLTSSLALLGLVSFAALIPTFVVGPFAGVVTDRLPKRRILLWTQTLSLAQSSVMTMLVLTSTVTVPHIIVLSVLLGLINSFDAPARQAFVVELVEKREDLGNAIALNSAMFNGARLIGPAVAGLLIAAAGEGVCFLANSASYVAVIIALRCMRQEPRAEASERRRIFKELMEGVAYAAGFSPIRSILLLMASVSLFGMPYGVLGPAFARDVLHGGAHTLGFLGAASGCGALLGALLLASRPSVRGLERRIPLAAAIFGLALMVYSQSTVLPLSLAALFCSGFAMMTYMASSNTVLQTIVEDRLRGRVMSFYAVSFLGFAPFGSLLAGTIAERIGAPETVLLAGACTLIGAVLFAAWLRPLQSAIRPIYVRKGIT